MGFSRRGLFQEDPGSTYGDDDGLVAPSVCDLHTRPPAKDVCDDMLLPSCWYGRESSKGLAMIGPGWRAERWSSDDEKAHRTRSDGASRGYHGLVRSKQLLLDIQSDTVIMSS